MRIDIAKVNAAFKERKRKPGEAVVPPVEQTAISREAHPGENDKLSDINKKLRSACKRPKQSVRKINGKSLHAKESYIKLRREQARSKVAKLSEDV